MQNFRVNTGEAQKLTQQIFNIVDDGWKMLVDGEEHAISDSYDLNKPVNRLNLYRTLRALDGEDYRAHHGADCTLDLMKITHWTPDTCSCTVSMTWRRDSEEADRVHKPHRSHAKCVDHIHLSSHADHHDELLSENRHKNHSVMAVAEHLEVHPGEIQFHHDADRTLVLKHAAFKNKVRHGNAHVHLRDHPEASKRKFKLVP